jgi:hypothetical protein
MAVDVSKIPNNNKFDPVRVAILNLQGQIEDTGGNIGDGTITINTSGNLTGSGTFTVNQAGPTTINIGIDDSSYLTEEVNDLTAAVTWANVPDANITQSSVTQHQAALSITESQISDLGDYIELGDLSTSTNPTPFGGGALLYDQATGVFEYTPPDLSQFITTDENDYLTDALWDSSTGVISFTVVSPGDVTVDIDGRYLELSGGTVDGDLTVTGDLTVSGTTTYINTDQLNIGDNIIQLNADLPITTAPTENAGIEVNRGSSTNVSFLWDETNDRWTLGSETLEVGGIAFDGGSQSEFLKADGSVTELTVVTNANNNPISSGALLYDTLTGNLDYTPPNLEGVLSEDEIDDKLLGYLPLTGGSLTGLLTAGQGIDVFGNLTVAGGIITGDGSGLTNLPATTSDLQDVTDNGASTTNSIDITSSADIFTALTLATTGTTYVKQDFITDTIAGSTAYLIAYGSANNQDGAFAIKNNANHTTTNDTAGDIWFANGASSSERMRIHGDTGQVTINQDLIVYDKVAIGQTASASQALHVDGNIIVGGQNHGFIHGGGRVALSADGDIIFVTDANDTEGETPDGKIVFGGGSLVDTNADQSFTFDDAFGEGLPRNEWARLIEGRFGIGETNPATKIHIKEEGIAPVLLTLQNTQVSGDIQNDGTSGNFIDFISTDANVNFTPQVRIGMVVQDYSGDNGIASEGDGNFVVYTGDGTDALGGGTLTEKFRVRHDGNSEFTNDVKAGSFTKDGGVQSEFLKADGSVTTLTVVTNENIIAPSSGALLYDTLTGNLEYTPPNLEGLVTDADLTGYLEYTDLSVNNFPNDPLFPGGKIEYSDTLGAISFYAADSSGGDADTLDGLNSTQFLRSDTADTFTGGTLTISATAPILDFVDTNSFTDANDRFRIRAAGDVGQIRWYDASASTDTVLTTFYPDGDVSIAGDITAPRIRLTATDDVSVSSTLHAFQIGADSGFNIAIDGNEIMARNNGAFSALNLNINGGDVNMGGGLIVSGTITGNGSGLSAVNATTLDGINSTQFLRSDTNDSTSGVLTVNGGTVTIVEDAGNRPKLTFQETPGADSFILEYNGAGSGAGNYVSFYSTVSGWAGLGEGLNYIPENGRVGIGEVSPSFPLHVSGKIYSTTEVQGGIATMRSYGGYAFFGSNASTTPLAFGRDGTSYDMVINGDGHVGMGGNTSPSYNLEINTLNFDAGMRIVQDTGTGYAPASIILEARQSTSRGSGLYHYNTQADISWYSGTLYNATDKWGIAVKTSETTWNPDVAQGSYAKFVVDSQGRVGIGTNDPQDMLHLKSTGDVQIRLEADTDNVGEDDNPSILLVQDGGAVSGRLNLSADNNLQLINQYDGAVQIGQNNTPNFTIDNTGKFAFGSALSTASHFMQLYDSTPWICITNTDETLHGIRFEDAQATSTQYSLFGYNCQTNHVELHINGTKRFQFNSDGNFHADNDITAFSTAVSDARLKDGIETIDNALDKVKSLRGVQYVWNKGSRKGQKDLGVVAQEVEQVLPEIVREKEMPLLDDSGEKYKTVDYEKMVGVLIEAIKEQQKQIDELKARLDA